MRCIKGCVQAVIDTPPRPAGGDKGTGEPRRRGRRGIGGGAGRGGGQRWGIGFLLTASPDSPYTRGGEFKDSLRGSPFTRQH